MSTASTLAGELFLLLASDADRTDSEVSRHALCSAMLAELALAERIQVGRKQDPEISSVPSDEPFGEPILDAVAQEIHKCDGMRVSELMMRKKTDVTEQIADDLRRDGRIRIREGLLGEPWAESTAEAVQPILERLTEAVDSPRKAEDRDAVLVHLLSGRQVAISLLLPHLEGYDGDQLQAGINRLISQHVSDDVRRLLDAAWSAERL